MSHNGNLRQTDTANHTGTLNYQWAFSLIHYFSLHGVSQAVISPGSRSTPLALACEQHPDIETWMQIDERCAGFFALGLAQQRQAPVIVICTSGSALSNWFPAVVEASHSYTPLLLLSADRPAELQGCGANQTIEQSFLFGVHTRDFIALEAADESLIKNNYLKRIATQAYDKSVKRRPGPVHINIPFREPLLPKRFTAEELNRFIRRLSEQIIHSATAVVQASTASLSITSTTIQSLCRILETGNGFILCGRMTSQEQNGFSNRLKELADQLNCPILLDPLSNQRLTSSVGEKFIFNYDHFLKNYHLKNKDSAQSLSPNWIIRFGQFPVSNSLMVFLQQLDCETILISPTGDWLDPVHKANTLLHTTPERFCQQLSGVSIKANSPGWLKNWLNTERQSETLINQALVTETLFEGHVIACLLENVPDNSFLFSGNSMAIRDFDTFITHATASRKNLELYGNRGVSGIDGNLSTFFGHLISVKKRGVAVIGDLSFYHDMNGLLIAKKLAVEGYNATIILINNHGGGIFSFLPQQQLNDFDKLWKTDTDLDFQYSAKLYGMDYYRIHSLDELDKKLPTAFSHSGIQLVEVIIDEQTSVECHQQI